MTVEVLTDAIYENYGDFIKEHRSEFRTAPEAFRHIVSKDSFFEAFSGALIDAVPSDIRDVIQTVLNRQRETLIEEAQNIAASPNAIAWAVASFPMLVDLYAEPILSRIATIYPVDKPDITIPKLTIIARYTDLTGAQHTVDRLPREDILVRGNNAVVTLTFPAGGNVATGNVFNLLNNPNVTSTTHRVNRRHFVIDTVTVNDASGAAAATSVINVSVRPNARGGFDIHRQFTNAAGTLVDIHITGTVNFATGDVQLTILTSDPTVTPASANIIARLSPVTGDVGRVSLELQQSGFDVYVDESDSFQINTTAELVQDFTSMYNIDVIARLSTAARDQMKLNRDTDLASLLQVTEVDMAANNTVASVDLAAYATGGAAGFTPNSILDVFKSVVPVISSVATAVRRVHRAEPQVLVTGFRAAALLDSLKDYYAKFTDMRTGTFGPDAGANNITRYQIIGSAAIPNDKIYVLYRAPANAYDRASIIDLTYKPMYVVEEVTNSVKRTFIKSRVTFEVVAPTAMGVVNVLNAANYLPL